MMKKMLPFLMAGAMALSCSSFVMAEDETFNLDEIVNQLQDVEVTEVHYSGKVVTWDDIAEIENSEEIVSNGSFVEEESLGIKYFLPDFMKEMELDEADKEAGLIKLYWNGDDASFFIQTIESIGLTSIDDYLKGFDESDPPMLLDFNGIEGILYFTESEDDSPSVMTVAYIPENTDTLVTFNYSPADSDSEYADYFRVMIASVQKIEEE